MQQRIVLYARRALLAGLVLTLCGGVRFPQKASAQGKATSVAPEPQASTDDAPMLLLMAPQPDSRSRDQQVNQNLQSVLRNALRASNRFQLFPFSPTQPVIKRAVLEHLIAVADLNEPVSQQAARRIARAIGARFLLTVSARREAENLTADARFEETLGQQDWRILFEEQLTLEGSMGKKRLKPLEVINMAVDAICGRMGVSSGLGPKPALTQIGAAPGKRRSRQGDGERAAKDPSSAGKTDTTGTSQQTRPAPSGPGSVVLPDKRKPDRNGNGLPTGTGKSAGPAVDLNRSARVPGSDPSAGNTESTKVTSPASGQGVPPVSSPRPIGKKPDQRTQTRVRGSTPANPDVTPGQPSEIAPPEVAPPPRAAPVDYESQVARYRQNGDLANVITSLRHAVNERPRDMGLRHLLVQAYRDRGLIEQALQETARALGVDPKNSGLHRLYGEALLARGDVSGARKAFEEAAKADPSDIAAQVALGDVRLADNQFTEAAAAYEAAGKSDPRSPLPHRRLARLLLGRAAADPGQYAAALTHINQARALLAQGDTETYLDDYAAFMRVMESRLRDMLDQLQAAYKALHDGKRNREESVRTAAEMRERSKAAIDFLEKLPPGAGQDVTHAQYQQGAALTQQAIDLFRDFLKQGQTSTEEAFSAARSDALHEFGAAARRLNAVRPPQAGGR